MDSVRRLSGVLGTNRVQERNARQQGDAFQRALQERGESAGDGSAAEREPVPPQRAKVPLRRGLQPKPADDRKQAGEAIHIDVVA